MIVHLKTRPHSNVRMPIATASNRAFSAFSRMTSRAKIHAITATMATSLIFIHASSLGEVLVNNALNTSGGFSKGIIFRANESAKT